jgi:hypothetical protein
MGVLLLCPECVEDISNPVISVYDLIAILCSVEY